MQEIKIKTLHDKQKATIEKTEDFFKNKSCGDFTAITENSSSSSVWLRLVKLIIWIALVFLIGGTGGIYINQVTIPYLLVKYPELHKYHFVQDINERITVIQETKNITLTDEDSTVEVIKKLKPLMVKIKIEKTGGVIVQEGVGLILTSDGYIITAQRNAVQELEKDITKKEVIKKDTNANVDVTTDYIYTVELANGSVYSAETVETSKEYSLAIIKIKAQDLAVIPYVDLKSLQQGQRVIILDDVVATDIIAKLVYIDDQSVGSAANLSQPKAVENLTPRKILVSRDLGVDLVGALAVNIKGELIGLVKEKNIIIPLQEFESFIQKALKK